MAAVLPVLAMVAGAGKVVVIGAQVQRLLVLARLISVSTVRVLMGLAAHLDFIQSKNSRHQQISRFKIVKHLADVGLRV